MLAIVVLKCEPLKIGRDTYQSQTLPLSLWAKPQLRQRKDTIQKIGAVTINITLGGAALKSKGSKSLFGQSYQGLNEKLPLSEALIRAKYTVRHMTVPLSNWLSNITGPAWVSQELVSHGLDNKIFLLF